MSKTVIDIKVVSFAYGSLEFTLMTGPTFATDPSGPRKAVVTTADVAVERVTG